MTCICSQNDNSQIEFFKGSTLNMRFTAREATHYPVRGVIVPGYAINLTDADFTFVDGDPRDITPAPTGSFVDNIQNP